MIELALYVVVFIALSGVMALVEASILGVSPAEVDESAAQNKIGAAALKQLFGRLTQAVVVLVIFTNIINVLGPILVGRKAIQLYGDRSIAIVTAILVVGTIIFSEILPKSLGSHYAPLVSRMAAPGIQIVCSALFPLVVALERFAGLFKSGERVIGTEEQIRSLAARGRKAGLIEYDEGQMIRRVFILNDRIATDIMTPLDRVVGVEDSMTISQAASIVFQHEYSRYPLFGETPNDIRGLVLSRQILGSYSQDRKDQLCRSVALPCPLVQADMPADALLVRFRQDQIHMAIVQERGRTVGLVTLEDVLEQLVGEIEDEKDSATATRLSNLPS